MSDLELYKEYILEKRLIQADNLNVLYTTDCHCGSAEHFYIAGVTHKKITCDSWNGKEHSFRPVCIHPYLFLEWANVRRSQVREEKINQIIK